MCQPDQAPPFYKHPNEPMRSLLLSCLLLLFGAVSAHAQSATTFQLPPEPDATSRPQAQGPVDLEGETRTAPRIIVKPTASPSATPTAQPSPRASATPATRPTPQPTRSSSEGPNLPSTDRSVSTQDLLTETPTRSMTRESRSDGESAQDSAANAQEEIDETSPVGPLSPSVATSADLTSADSPSAGLASDDAADLPAAPEGGDSDVDMEAMAAMRKTNLELHKAISEDMKQFLTANPGGTIQKWAASSEWTRDTGGERDATGAPVRVTTGIFLELFQSMVTEVAAAAPADEDGW